MLVLSNPLFASDDLNEFISKVTPEQIFSGATHFGEISGTPLSAPIYKHDDIIGYVFLNSDVVNTIGYSGKPIHIVVGIDLDGNISGAKLVKHSEPIVLIGIPVSKINAFIDGYVGMNVLELLSSDKRDTPPVDIISGATVTVLIIHDTITRAAIKVIRSRNLAGTTSDDLLDKGPVRVVDLMKDEVRSWKQLLGDGSVRRLNITVEDINNTFDKNGPQEARNRPENGEPTDTYIDMYTALVSVPTIGRSLLGDAEYELMKARLQPGQQAVLIAGNGVYSFKGSGYVRGGIFDRIHLVQGEDSVRFHDRNHKRLGDVEAEGAPKFTELALFLMPKGFELKPAKQWRIELLANRAIGAIKKAFVSFSLSYVLPESYLVPLPEVPIKEADENTGEIPLWERIWLGRIVDIIIITAAITALTFIFFFQNLFITRPVLMKRVRTGFLLFTVIWIGGYAGAQLSVVNVMTFFGALISGFSWQYFLMDPLLFILWTSVAASLIFWGRGAYCGWLCPFGAMQELLNMVAKSFRVPQLTIPWGLHERLWPIKYMIFMGLFGLSLYSLEFAEKMAEVEPFKTAIVLRFARDWPFVIYALTLLSAGLFVERFFCRYLCPLGAGLAIPARIRMFDWLKRRRECGAPCRTCEKECMVNAIHPTGEINPNECLYCLHCQVVYSDEHKCPPLVQLRLRRDRREALSTNANQ